MFLGRYSHNVDTKGRLAIPARFREALGTEVVITRGIDRCLSLYPMDTWVPLAEKVSSLSISDPDARTFRRMVFAEAAYLDVDRQGRILLPADLRQYAEIDKDATVVGVHSYIEIWSPDRWGTQSQVMDEEASSIAQRLAEFI
ncbi:MAG: division/cell wall cluster transcriptional repressor MraZ [Thermomicrobiaceae bacterium]